MWCPQENNEKNMRKPLLLHKALTDHTWGNNKVQQIKKMKMKQPQHMLSMQQPSVEHEVSMSYASPPIWKLHPCGDIISELYKPTFHSGHFSCNTSDDGTATIWVFHLPQQRYSYSTQSSMTELPLSVSQYWNLHLE